MTLPQVVCPATDTWNQFAEVDRYGRFLVQRYARHNSPRYRRIMNHPLQPNHSSDDSTPEDVGNLVHLWFAIAVIGLFVFASFYVLKVAVDLFLPIVLAGSFSVSC
jgi:hypothetical protein